MIQIEMIVDIIHIPEISVLLDDFALAVWEN